MEDFISKYDGNQIDSRLDKVKDMVGATASGLPPRRSVQPFFVVTAHGRI